MDINFPLILVLLVFVSGFIWLLDIFILAPRRKRNTEGNSTGNSAGNSAVQEPVYVEYSKSFFPVLFIVFVLRSFIVEPFQIPSPSMVPTLKVGDFILVNKFTYGLRLPVIRNKVIDINQPQRGDVMVFFPPHEKRYFIKRVVGLPGDKVSYNNNQLYLNGEKVDEALQATLPSARPFYQIYNETLGDAEHQTRKLINPNPYVGNQPYAVKEPYTVPAGHYFMMGDNRNNSSDSRVWGPVPEENIVGKAFAIWMHWESLLSLPSFSRVGSID